MNNYQKYLPLGTVVMLKKGKHRAMIVGYCVKLAEDPKAPYYDYMGCLFPEGIFTTEQSLVFNHSDIDEIYYMGYVDEETKKFQIKLKETIEKIDKE